MTSARVTRTRIKRSIEVAEYAEVLKLIYSSLERMSNPSTRGNIGRGQRRIRKPKITKNPCHKLNPTVTGMYSLIHPKISILIFLTPPMRATV